MTDVTERDTHESKVRDVLAVYDRNAVLESEHARLRYALDLAGQKLAHVQADLDQVKLERDHYLAQVAAFREKFEHAKNSAMLLARMFREMIDESTAQQAQIEQQ